jgi:hypothetical protein
MVSWPQKLSNLTVTRFDDFGDCVFRTRTPLALFVLDRWFRMAELPFDLIEWRFPQTGAVTTIPCRLYARWNTFRIGYETIDEFAITPEE